ncbi:RNB-domain-containing protein [Hesseltinella vesiculosa]|uniref:RNB-domain-containing protein n=1 Tax=Hesseltinella vesiculosa TaxID=101127 RepID=A0A1X2GCY2_9FUNG|nr:RNB-domain-containing protein [Hesseltinella vesiculosa]
MPSRQYQPPSRPPAVIAQDERTLRHQKRRPDQKQPSRLHPDDHCPHGKRHQFERFMDRDKVEMALAQGELYQGLLRINAKKPIDAYVTCDALDSDVFVCNARTRNRALEGDLVAIQLLDIDQVWKQCTDRDERHREKQQQNHNLDQTATASDNNDSNSEAADKSQDKEEMKPKYAGKVVYILDRAGSRSFSGTLSAERPGAKSVQPVNGRISTYWFKPMDKRVPLIMIKPEDLPGEVIKDLSSCKDSLVETAILHWPIHSLLPFGRFLQVIGPIGDRQTEQHALLTEHNIFDVPFDDVVAKTLENIPRNIPDLELKLRRDLREELVFTIDPATAKDLDDAMHVKRLVNGHFEVGVHIADVSYYVKPGTPLDMEAMKRGTTTYLVNRSVPMLPHLLCESLCSLTPHQDKLAYSVVWTLDHDGKIIDTWFGRTIIKSKAKFSYEQVQSVIDGHALPASAILDHSDEDVVAGVLDLYRLSTQLRARRYANGALSLNSAKLVFDLDEQDCPVDVSLFEAKEANRLVEEFMLLANGSVAKKIQDAFPNEAFLRRHEPPIPRRLNRFAEVAKSLGYPMDVESAAGVQASMAALDDADVKEALMVLAIRPMKRAKYFCGGMQTEENHLHYALNMPLYTHFTSPIRRYADILVHRQLTAALAQKDLPSQYDKIAMHKLAIQCNRRKDFAKNMQDADRLIFLVDYLKRQESTMIERAVVIHVSKKAFELYLPKFGHEYRLPIDKLPLRQSLHKDGRLHLFWQLESQPSGLDLTNKLHNLSLQDHDEAGPVRLHPTPLEHDTCMQTIDLFATLDVCLIPDATHSPPQLHMVPVNPFLPSDLN